MGEREQIQAATGSPVSRARGWYLWDYDRCEVVRGPFPNAGTAGAVRTEMERNPDEERNLWVVYHRTIAAWEAELAQRALTTEPAPQATPPGPVYRYQDDAGSGGGCG